MGNALGYLYGKCCKPTTDDDSLGPHGVSTVGLSALAHDLFNFEITSQVLDFITSAFNFVPFFLFKVL